MNILLLEPAYRNKYPPLGLMKIAYFHKEMRKDPVVHFAKGKLPDEDSTKWDRIYITTLFTFEWAEIEKTIDYAISLVEDRNKIFVGGIAATLLDKHILKEKPGINVIKGLLNEPGKIGLEGDHTIDTLPPDYRILDDIEYKYPTANSYFAYTTRGCGMNCSFCAVKILEPKYESFVSIKEQINKVKEFHGEKKDLLLMDNNVLISKHLPQIIDELIELGFGKGAKFINNGKEVNRIVDFNQGLDANFLTERNARLLARLELRPVRIAFDHIRDKEIYVRAIERCVQSGLREFSNYALYNSDASTGKGKEYPYDTPEELYLRLVENTNLQERLRTNQPDNDRVSIYSFPMRYIPLDNLQRGYIGKGWNSKFLRAVTVMLTPTQGKGVSSKDFFEAACGKSLEEFNKILLMPEKIIASRGFFVKKKDETDKERDKRHRKWEISQAIWAEWERLFKLIPDHEYFTEIIKDSSFSFDVFRNFKNTVYKKIYLHYFSPSKLLELLQSIENESKDCLLIQSYFKKETPILLEYLANYINSSKLSYYKLSGYIKFFGHHGIEDYIKSFATPNRFSGINKEDGDDFQKGLYKAWLKSYEDINDKVSFVRHLKNYDISAASYYRLIGIDQQKAYFYYLTECQLLELFKKINSEKDVDFIFDFFTNKSPNLFVLINNYIYSKCHSTILIVAYVRIFRNIGVNSLLDLWFKDNCQNDLIINFLERTFISLKSHYADIITLRALKMFLEQDVFTDDKLLDIKNMFSKNEYDAINSLLKQHYETFEQSFLDNAPGDFTSEAWRLKAKEWLSQFYKITFQRLF